MKRFFGLGAALATAGLAAAAPALPPPSVEVLPGDPYPAKASPATKYLTADAAPTGVAPTVPAPYTNPTVVAAAPAPVAAPAADCSTGQCSARPARPRGDCLDRLVGWFCYKPGPAVVPQCQPEPYHPNLLKFFPCRAGVAGCAPCGGAADGVTAVAALAPGSPKEYQGQVRVAPNAYPLGRIPAYEVPSEPASAGAIPGTPPGVPEKEKPKADPSQMLQGPTGTPKLSRMGPPRGQFPAVVSSPFTGTTPAQVGVTETNGTVVTEPSARGTVQMPPYRAPSSEVVPVEHRTAAPRRGLLDRALDAITPTPTVVPANPYAKPYSATPAPAKAPLPAWKTQPEYPAGPIGFPTR